MSSNCEFDISDGSEAVPVRVEDGQLLNRLTNYVRCNIPGPGTDTSAFEEQIQGCSCTGQSCDISHDTNCTCLKFGCCYTEDKKLRLDILENKERLHSSVFIECNSNCPCSKHCYNRIAQYGLSLKTEVYQDTEKGLCLRTLEPIERGRFVCEYAGEVLSPEEARRRILQLTKQDMNYIFAIKEHVSSGLLTTYIDPSKRGNVGRFINHSCDPNLVLFPVRVNNLVPMVCLFAARDIEANEELTYKYGELNKENDSANILKTVCKCGAQSCCGYLPFDAAVLQSP